MRSDNSCYGQVSSGSWTVSGSDSYMQASSNHVNPSNFVHLFMKMIQNVKTFHHWCLTNRGRSQEVRHKVFPWRLYICFSAKDYKPPTPAFDLLQVNKFWNTFPLLHSELLFISLSQSCLSAWQSDHWKDQLFPDFICAVFFLSSWEPLYQYFVTWSFAR